jgi:hypothetical protein
MSNVESTDEITPKSVLRHRPIGDNKPPTGKRSVITTAAIPAAPRSSRLRAPVHAVEEGAREKDEATTSLGEQPPTPKKSTKQFPLPVTILPNTPRPHMQFRHKYLPFSSGRIYHPLLYCGLGMLGMLLFWTIGTFMYTWLATWHDDIQYGRPRTFQTDAWVGHNEQAGMPSHFIVLNLNRHIEIIEFPGGDASRARIYTGPQLYGPDDALVPVTLRFVDVNNDHKPDMLILFQASTIVYLNDQGSFRPLLPTEHPLVELFLQHLQT